MPDTKTSPDDTTTTPSKNQVFNLPNQITMARLVLSVVVFVLISFQLYFWAMVLFVIAASTDWVDGYIARKYNMVTVLGRILDPFVDKVIVCGSFIYLVSVPTSGVQPWMVVVIVGREMLVTALRSYVEQQGADFSASMWGKLKMVMQSVAIPVSLFYAHVALTNSPEILLGWTRDICIWSAVILTFLSGVVYIFEAVKIARGRIKS